MSQKDSQYATLSSILNSIDNIADKVLDYQSGKADLARAFARKLDTLIYNKQLEMENEKRPQNIDGGNTMDKKEKEKELNEIIKLKEKLLELSTKITELKDKSKSNKIKDKDFDIDFTIVDKPIDTLAIVEGILSSPSGDDMQFLHTSVKFLHQKNSERVKELTGYELQDVRDTFLGRLAQDSKIWDNEIRILMQSLMVLTKNVSMSIKNSGNQNQPNDEDLRNLQERVEGMSTRTKPYQV